MKVTWSPLALERAAEAAAYIAKDDPASARRWVDSLFDLAAGLSTFPERGRVVPGYGRGPYREVFHGRYRVIYRIAPKSVVVLTVRHGRRLLDPAELGETP
ncbi:MAG: type II toxin-antitoxin system RelE/ParE family toxin [Thermoanaerobaculia bacterium]